MSFLLSYHRPAFKARILAGVPLPGWLLKHCRTNYIVSAILSFPYWVDRKELRIIHDERIRLTRETGIPHHIDHDIPIRHPLVCGLTVPWNLRVIPANANMSKGGKWSPIDYHQQEMQL